MEIVRGARLTPSRRREQLADVAAAMIEADGVDSLSMTALAEAAGVTRALVYRYFPGRDEVITEVLRRKAEELLAATEPRPGATARENLERSLSVYVEHFAPTLERVRDGAAPSLTREIAAHARDVQVERVRGQLVDPDQPGAGERLHAWLMLVEDLAATNSPAFVAWCLDALQGLFGDNLDLDA